MAFYPNPISTPDPKKTLVSCAFAPGVDFFLLCTITGATIFSPPALAHYGGNVTNHPVTSMLWRRAGTGGRRSPAALWRWIERDIGPERPVVGAMAVARFQHQQAGIAA